MKIAIEMRGLREGRRQECGSRRKPEGKSSWQKRTDANSSKGDRWPAIHPSPLNKGMHDGEEEGFVRNLYNAALMFRLVKIHTWLACIIFVITIFFGDTPCDFSMDEHPPYFALYLGSNPRTSAFSEIILGNRVSEMQFPDIESAKTSVLKISKPFGCPILYAVYPF